MGFADPTGLDKKKDKDEEEECDSGNLFQCETEIAGEFATCNEYAIAGCALSRNPALCGVLITACAGKYAFDYVGCLVDSNCF